MSTVDDAPGTAAISPVAVATAAPPAGADGTESGRHIPDRLGYQPALDGLRALAVLAVIFYHDSTDNSFGHTWAQGGSLGVDIFFVLSGFLITSLLLIERAKSGKAISRQFWVRRLRRLLPAILVLLLLTSIYALFFAEPWELDPIRNQGLATLFYVQNWYIIYGNGAFTPLSHTWSLSIEEQWYLVWPLALAGILILSKGRHSRVLWVILGLVAASALCMAAVYDPVNWGRAYNGTDSRAFELLIGAGLAVMVLGRQHTLSKGAQRALEAAGLVSMAFLLWAIASTTADESWLFHGGYVLIAIAAATVIAACTQTSSTVLRPALSWRPLIAIGLISYGLYLFHLPLFDWLTPERVGVGGRPLLLLRLAAVFGFAALSYFLIEMPIRRGWLVGRRATVLIPLGIVGTIVVLFFATRGGHAEPLLEFRNREFAGFAATTPEEDTRVLAAGDGFAFDLGQQLDGGWFAGDGIRGVTATSIYCGIQPGNIVINDVATIRQCGPSWQTDFEQAVESFRPEVSVLTVGSLAIFDREVRGEVLRVGSPELAQVIRTRLDRARDILTADGAPLVVLGTPCVAPGPDTPPEVAAIQADPQRLAWVNGLLRDFAESHDAEYADLGTLLCPDGVAGGASEGEPFRRDGTRLTRAGAEGVWRWLAPIVKRAESR